MLFTRKDPDEVLDFAIDWSDRLQEGDTIASASFALATANGLAIDSDSNTTTSSTVVLSGGTANRIGTVTCRVVTAAARVLDETLVVRVKAR